MTQNLLSVCYNNIITIIIVIVIIIVHAALWLPYPLISLMTVC